VEQHPELVALVLASKGDAQAREGRLAQAYDAFAAGASAATAPGAETVLIECLGHMAVLACFGGQLSRADSLARRSVELADQLGVTKVDRPPGSAAALAWLSAERDEPRAALEHVANAQASDPMFTDPVADTLLTIARARLQVAQGDVAAALATLEEKTVEAADRHDWMLDKLSVEKGHLRVVSGDPAVALLEVEEVRSGSSAAEVALVSAQAALAMGDDRATGDLLKAVLDGGAPLMTQVEGWLVESARQLRGGSSVRARSALERALRLAARGTLRRPFRQAAGDVRRLLANDPDLLAENPWLNGAAPRGAPVRGIRAGGMPLQRPSEAGEQTPVVEKLTAKELEVLGHLAELLTTEEIASTMFVSVNTIRTHVRSILRKLGVNRRNSAVRRARELGLLDRHE
jgi:LuxR family maltose regulon positive regulatory protein